MGAVPIPGREGISLTMALNEALQHNPTLGTAIELIHALERQAPLPNDICDVDRQGAAELLLSHGQFRLLLQLAQQLPHPYHLDVGASEQRAQVLNEIGQDWPVGATSVALASSLSSQAVHGLQAFLARPSPLSVDLLMDQSLDATAVGPLADTLKRHDIATWTLRCPDGIQAAGLEPLEGITAQALVFDYEEPEDEPDPGLLKVLLNIVRAASARSVDLSNVYFCHEPVDHDFIETPDDWERIIVREDQVQTLSAETTTLTLEIQNQGILDLNAEFLASFGTEQFCALTTNAMVDLRQAIALGYAAGWIESMEACFFVKEGDDVNDILGEWQQDGIQKLQHRMRPNCYWQGHTQVSDDTAASSPRCQRAAMHS